MDEAVYWHAPCRQLRQQLDWPYSVRPNAGNQFTSDLTKQAEQNAPTLTMRLEVAVPPNATANKLKAATSRTSFCTTTQATA